MEPTFVEPKQKESTLLVAFSIIVAGALIGAGIFFSRTQPNKVAGTRSQNPTIGGIEMTPISDSDHLLGNPNAPVIIVEYSDTECPFCKVFHQTLKQIMNDYGKDGKVAWVYRHFPIEALHSRAPKEAEATECAAEQGGNDAFWKYTDTIFTQTNSNNSLDPSELPKIAQSVGLNVSKFNSCLSSGKYTNKIKGSVVEGAGVSGPDGGTPTSIVMTRDGQKVTIRGAQSYDTVKAIVDAALKQQLNTN